MTEKLNDWQKEFEIKAELTQGDLEALELALFKLPNIATTYRRADLSLVKGAYLRAAIQAGWIVSPECKSMTDKQDAIYIYAGQDVDDMHPAKVAWLGSQVVQRYEEIMGADLKNL